MVFCKVDGPGIKIVAKILLANSPMRQMDLTDVKQISGYKFRYQFMIFFRYLPDLYIYFVRAW